jgi:hypothetical protein
MTCDGRAVPTNGILIASFLRMALAGEPALVPVFISTTEIL